MISVCNAYLQAGFIFEDFGSLAIENKEDIGQGNNTNLQIYCYFEVKVLIS